MKFQDACENVDRLDREGLTEKATTTTTTKMELRELAGLMSVESVSGDRTSAKAPRNAPRMFEDGRMRQD